VAVFISASALFAMTFAIHVIWWRLKVPRRQSFALAMLFLSTAVCGFAVVYVADPFSGELPLPRLLLAVLLFGGVGLVYLILFSAVEQDSPSFALIRLISEAGRRGIHRNDLMRIMRRHSHTRARIELMISDGMAMETPTGLRLASQGLWLSRVVLFYRKLLARKTVGG
jgi:predicted permease